MSGASGFSGFAALNTNSEFSQKRVMEGMYQEESKTDLNNFIVHNVHNLEM